MLQDVEGAVEAGTRLMGEKRREENFKESSRLPSIKAQSSLNLALTSTPTLH